MTDDAPFSRIVDNIGKQQHESTRPTKRAVNEQLSFHLTPRGVRLWWGWKSWQLGDKTPQEAWDEGRKQDVLEYAIGGRESGGT